MRAKIYFEAQGRRDREQGLPARYDVTAPIPQWAFKAYHKGYVYQKKIARFIPKRKRK